MLESIRDHHLRNRPDITRSTLQCITWMICKVNSRKVTILQHVSCKIFFKTIRSTVLLFPSRFFPKSFVEFQILQTHTSTDKATTRKNSRFILYNSSFFCVHIKKDAFCFLPQTMQLKQACFHEVLDHLHNLHKW